MSRQCVREQPRSPAVSHTAQGHVPAVPQGAGDTPAVPSSACPSFEADLLLPPVTINPEQNNGATPAQN